MNETSSFSVPDGPFVSALWVKEAASQEGLRLVDIRGRVLPPDAPPPRYQPKRDDYVAGHLPGAVFVDWTRDIVDLDDAVPSQIAPPDKFAACMGGLGIGNDTWVVVYDDYSHMFAGRLYWALRYFGHSRVRVLEGGLSAWQQAGGVLTQEVPTYAPQTFVPKVQPPLRRTADQVADAMARGVTLLDARGAAQFEGLTSAAKRAGHIPGARNVPYPSLLEDPAGPLRTESELGRIFELVGVSTTEPEQEIIVYCNGGISATVPLLALHRLGMTNVSLYDGSWNEWGNDPNRPLETGKSRS
jgi:thiosulfate/3-mercaptopyruvate sulfurtransferase